MLLALCLLQGWDKTYCLQFVKEFDEVHFFGDKTYQVRVTDMPQFTNWEEGREGREVRAGEALLPFWRGRPSDLPLSLRACLDGNTRFRHQRPGGR